MISNNQSLQFVLEHVYFPQRLRIGSEQTRQHYRLTVRQLGQYLRRKPLVTDLVDDVVAGYVAWLRKRLATRTVNQRLDYLRALSGWLFKRALVTSAITLENLKVPAVIPQVWTEDEIHRLAACCAAQQGHVGGVPASLWWLGLHCVLWDTAERTWAALAIRMDWLDWRAARLEIPAHVRKGGVKPMAYWLMADTMAVLGEMWEPERTLLFPWPQSRATFYNAYKRLLREAGLPDDRYSQPQRMRRSFATHLEAAGGDATDALGHSSRLITVKSYLAPALIAKVAPNRLLFRMHQQNAPDAPLGAEPGLPVGQPGEAPAPGAAQDGTG